MPVDITPIARHTGVAIARPVPGEPAAMETGPAPLGPELQKLVDRLELYLQATLGEMRGGEEFRVYAGGSSTTGSAEINAIDRLVITDADGVTWAVSSDGNPVAFFASANYPGGTLPNSAWVYASVSVDTDGVTLIPRLGDDPPDPSHAWIEGFEGTRRFVGCFRTSSAGAPIPQRTVRGRTTYLETVPGGTAITDTATLGAYTAISLASLVPPHARVATLDIAVSGGGGGGTAYRSIGDGGGDVSSQVNHPMVLNGSQQIEWHTFGGSGGISINVRGHE